MKKLSFLLFSAVLSFTVLPVLDSFAQMVPARAKTGTRLITLGTAAGPPPKAGRAQSSNLLTVNGAHYVIYAGDGVARRIAKAGINVRDIGTIFITHHHDDHTAGLGADVRRMGQLMNRADQRLRPTADRGPGQSSGALRHQRRD